MAETPNLDRRDVVRKLLAYAGESRLNLAGAFQRGLYVRQDVLLANMFNKLRLLEKFRRLPPRAAEQHKAAGSSQLVVQHLQGVQPCCIDGGHVAKA